MTDPAAFRSPDINRVYGPRHVCFQTAKDQTQGQPVDPHHILGRGNTTDRAPFSSLLNLAWLRRDVHEGPLRDASDQARVYLRIAEARVMNAVGLGEYTLCEEDYRFIDHCREMGIYEHAASRPKG